MTKSRREWALDVARRGFFIFPLRPGTKSGFYSKSWSELQTRDPDQINKWFEELGDINYGVCPGPHGAIIDLDFGKRGKEGDKVFAAIETQQDITEFVSGQTFEVTSPSGGHHLYLTVDEPVSNGHGFGKDVDVRGDGGYVVGPGCFYDTSHDPKAKDGDISGHYTTLHDLPFKKAPAWCIEKMRARELNTKPLSEVVELDLPESISAAKEFIRRRAPAVEGMGGDPFTYATCAALRRDFALSGDTALELLSEWKHRTPYEPEDAPEQTWNDRCCPPWDVYGPLNTLESKMRNAGVYASHHQGEKSGAILTRGLDPSILADALEAAKVEAVEADEARSRLEQHFYRGQVIFDKIKQQSYVIPYWLLAHGVTGLLGKSGIGKSTVLIDMALRIAHDMDWHGTPIRKGLRALYMCGEDQEGAVEQIKAWCIENKRPFPEPERFIFVPGIIPLDNEEEAMRWISTIRDCVGKTDVVAFLDTWQRAIGAMSQNEESDMQTAVKRAEYLGRAIDGPVIVSFHPPKTNEETVSGWQGQINSCCGLWQIKQDPRGIKMSVSKIRGKGKDNYVIYSMKECKTGDKDQYFGFEICHMIPERVGGNRVTADGVIIQEENMNQVREAVCRVLAAMEANRLSVGREDQIFKKPFTVKIAAALIVGAEGSPITPMAALADEWSREQMAVLEAAGLKFPMEQSTMADLIERVLGPGDHPGGFDLGDGNRLWIDTASGAHRLVVDSSGIRVS